MNSIHREIPIVDLGPVREGRPGAREKTASAICAALEGIGFFGVRNHGVPDKVVANAFSASRAFFTLPENTRMALKINSSHRGYMPMADQHRAEQQHPNLSESFLIGSELADDDPDVLAGLPLHGPNQWPEGLPGFREAMETYRSGQTKLGLRLVELFETALEVPHGFFLNCFEFPMAFIRALHYPPAPADLPEGQFGAAPHSDFGFLTILAQDDIGGLQVRTRNGEWIDAPNLPGTFMVNVGDMLMRWTNDRFLSNQHRVISPGATERFSLPFFFDPSFATVVKCIDSCCGSDNPPRYEPTTWGDFLTARFDANHKYRQEQAAE